MQQSSYFYLYSQLEGVKGAVLDIDIIWNVFTQITTEDDVKVMKTEAMYFHF